MDLTTFAAHKVFAGEKKPSMLRRRAGHDYASRCIYLVTLTTEGRRPMLGTLVGDEQCAHVELTELGRCVQECWMNIHTYHPNIRVLATCIMPDHLHGILFIEENKGIHLSQAINGFKTGCNKAYRRLFHLSDFAAALPQQREQRGGKREREERTHGLLWARGYNDHILEGRGELQRWFEYLKDNPRRLAIRRAHPDYFRVRFGLKVGTQEYAAIGNRFLLNYPNLKQVQLSRSLTDEQISREVEHHLHLARHGTVLVSPAISKGEQAVMRAILDARRPLIFLTPWGFNEFSRPGHQYYEACSEGRFLMLAPWPKENQRQPLTRQMCLSLNEMTRLVCEER